MWGAIIAGAGMLRGSKSSKYAAKQAQITAGINADLVREESLEERRRLERDVSQAEGMMSAMSAASGVQVSGSRDLSIQDTKKENKAQIEWLMKSSKQKVKAIRRGGQIQASQLKSQAQMQTIKGFGQIAQSLYGSYNT